MFPAAIGSGSGNRQTVKDQDASGIERCRDNIQNIQRTNRADQFHANRETTSQSGMDPGNNVPIDEIM